MKALARAHSLTGPCTSLSKGPPDVRRDVPNALGFRRRRNVPALDTHRLLVYNTPVRCKQEMLLQTQGDEYSSEHRWLGSFVRWHQFERLELP